MQYHRQRSNKAQIYLFGLSVFEGCDRRGLSLLFAETIPISHCRREKGVEVLVSSCIYCFFYIICVSKIISRCFIDSRWYKRK